MLYSAETPQALYYNRFRASNDKQMRRFLDVRFGMPLGYRSVDSTYDVENRSSVMAAALRQQGYVIDQQIEFGQDPAWVFQFRNPGAALPDPLSFTPARDMSGSSLTTPRPFSEWFMQHSTAYEQGEDKDPLGIGTLYECGPNDRWDIGAWWTDAKTGHLFEKVIWRHFYALPRAWERIALPVQSTPANA